MTTQVAESGFKTIKTEFVYPRRFDSLEQLELELAAYVYWYNNIQTTFNIKLYGAS